MNTILYCYSLPKRHALAHKIYRRMHRAYAWFLKVIDPRLTMVQFFALIIGGCIFLLVLTASLLTLLIP